MGLAADVVSGTDRSYQKIARANELTDRPDQQGDRSDELAGVSSG
jgi:hypothetical protein